MCVCVASCYSVCGEGRYDSVCMYVVRYVGVCVYAVRYVGVGVCTYVERYVNVYLSNPPAWYSFPTVV